MREIFLINCIVNIQILTGDLSGHPHLHSRCAHLNLNHSYKEENTK